MFDVPAAFAEFDGEPVEKGLIARGVADDAEVFCGFDEAGAEDFLPEAIDGDASGQGVIRGSEPCGETEPVFGGVGGHGVEGLEGGGFDLFARLIVVAAEEDVSGGRGVAFFLLDVGDGTAVADGDAFLFEGREGLAEVQRWGVEGGEVEVVEGLLLFRRAFVRIDAEHGAERAVFEEVFDFGGFEAA